ncbi:hypothetical protein [Orlajensenia leifsoniae]|uniref:Uncharacterized protein n=1 Tax=Orlajensenia leifsoniae TaxID=2561933 RepID=A0A4Y9QW82_9MICO|nr:hypothetical protein [Leifsonia flava]TFV95393.1 hypothetical protein E4M00_15215 [Leifsonia flava]
MATLAEFNSGLLIWLSETIAPTIGSGSNSQQMRVLIGRTVCWLRPDTTRGGVTAYLAGLIAGETTYSVVPSSKGVVHRIAIGDTNIRIPGFYLYTLESFDIPTTIDPDASAFDLWSVCRLILEAVALLHSRGHQRLRILPNISGSGMQWRATIGSVDALRDWPGTFDPGSCFVYTTGDGFTVAGLPVDAQTDAESMADRILDACRDPGLGQDWEYAGWYVEMLGTVRRNQTLPNFEDPGWPFMPGDET